LGRATCWSRFELRKNRRCVFRFVRRIAWSLSAEKRTLAMDTDAPAVTAAAILRRDPALLAKARAALRLHAERVSGCGVLE